jgi:hypothetical protein
MSALGVVDMVDVQEAATIAGRDPETIRRWIRSGRLAAQRRANRLLVPRVDVERLVGIQASRPRMSLAAWRDHATSVRAATEGTRSPTAADLVLGDRARH